MLLTKFRLTALNLEIEGGRQNDIQKEDRLCKLCERNSMRKKLKTNFIFFWDVLFVRM